MIPKFEFKRATSEIANKDSSVLKAEEINTFLRLITTREWESIEDLHIFINQASETPNSGIYRFWVIRVHQCLVIRKGKNDNPSAILYPSDEEADIRALRNDPKEALGVISNGEIVEFVESNFFQESFINQTQYIRLLTQQLVKRYQQMRK